LGAAFTNLKIYKGGFQLAGTTTVVPNTSDPSGTGYTFYITPALSIAAGQSIVIDLKATVLSPGLSWSNGEATQLVSAQGTGKVSNNTIYDTQGAQGQAIYITAGDVGLKNIENQLASIGEALKKMLETAKGLLGGR